MPEEELHLLDAATKAKLATQWRKEARDCLERYRNATSNIEKGGDVADLECYMSKLRLRTRLFPSPGECSSCYGEYGESLRILGEHFRTLAVAQGVEARKASDPEKRRSLAALAEENERKATSYYRQALENLNAHLRSGARVDDRAYFMAFEVASRLENYKLALKYLEAYERNNSRLPSDRKEEVERWRKWANDQYQRLQRDKAREELN